MSEKVMEGLQVLITGIGDSVSRDVARMLAAEGACVTAVCGDPYRLARFERDLRLFRTQVQAVHLNLTQPSAVRVFEENLRFFDRLPHVIVCCTPMHGEDAAALFGDGVVPAPTVKAISCEAHLAAKILQPSLVLHAKASRASRLRRAIQSLRHRNLFELLGRGRERGLLESGVPAPVVRLGAHLFTVERPGAYVEADEGQRRGQSPRARAIAARRLEAARLAAA